MLRTLPLALIVVLVATLARGAAAEAPAGKGIYTCRDSHGNPILRDRPIAECFERDQDELNRDGSPRRQLPAPLTADEAARREAQAQRLREEQAARAEALRYDRLLLVRYPDEAAHEQAHEKDLDAPRNATKASEQRLEELRLERVRLDQEAEFYKGRPMPDKLRQSLGNNKAAADAQRQSMANQGSEMERINRKYDAERDRLRKLWKGAPPGSVGPVPRADR